MISEEKRKEIERGASVYGKKTWEETGETETSVLTFTGKALMGLSAEDYISGATKEAERALPLLKIIEELMDFNPDRDSKFTWTVIRKKAQTAIKNYKQ